MELSTIMTPLVCAMIIHTAMATRVTVTVMPVDIQLKNLKVTIGLKLSRIVFQELIGRDL